MNWDYGEDQDDGYCYDDKPYPKTVCVYMYDDEVVLEYFTHNGGHPSSVHRIARKDLVEYLETTIFEKFQVPHGFAPKDVREAILLCKIPRGYNPLRGYQSP